MSDYENIDDALELMGLAREYLTQCAVKLQRVKVLNKTTEEIKNNIGDFCISEKLLREELKALNKMGKDDF